MKTLPVKRERHSRAHLADGLLHLLAVSNPSAFYSRTGTGQRGPCPFRRSPPALAAMAGNRTRGVGLEGAADNGWAKGIASTRGRDFSSANLIVKITQDPTVFHFASSAARSAGKRFKRSALRLSQVEDGRGNLQCVTRVRLGTTKCL